MKREEEIKQAAFERFGNNGNENQYEIAKVQAFIVGSKWADKTMIDKACEWLKEVFVCQSNVSSWNIQTDDYNSFQEMIEDFRKSMKGE